MKLLVLDGKRMGAVITVMGLMILLFGLGMNFNNRIRATAFIQNNLGELTQYKIDKFNLRYKLPSKWITKLQNFSGGEIVYHNDFKSPDNVIHGFVELWKMDDSLMNFLNKSKTASETQNEILDYSMNSIKINNCNGYLVTYTTVSNGQNYKAYEYFIKEDGEFIRFSFYVNSNKLDSNMPSVFKAIVETFCEQ